MTELPLKNPYSAPVFRMKTCASTMLEGRKLEAGGLPSGTVIVSDFQSAGYGRLKSRRWLSKEAENLLFTFFLRFPSFADIPKLITLRIGLAVLRSVSAVFPVLEPDLKIKWPNDIMLDSKKICGVLTESDGKNVFSGVGLNVFQTDFAGYKKASSIAGYFSGAGLSLPAVSGFGAGDNERLKFCLLEKFLFFLFEDLGKADAASDERALFEINKNLFMKGREVIFLRGAADSGGEVHGTLCGLSESGGLLIRPRGGAKTEEFVSGELVF